MGSGVLEVGLWVSASGFHSQADAFGPVQMFVFNSALWRARVPGLGFKVGLVGGACGGLGFLKA